MKTVLVTGAGGYIGSVLTAHLIDHGYHVIAFDRFFFGQDTLERLRENPLLTIVKKDIRRLKVVVCGVGARVPRIYRP